MGSFQRIAKGPGKNSHSLKRQLRKEKHYKAGASTSRREMPEATKNIGVPFLAIVKNHRIHFHPSTVSLRHVSCAKLHELVFVNKTP